jgi:MoxR-like ATPase
MAARLNEVRKAMNDGSRFVVVQDDDVDAYVEMLLEEEAAADADAVPVLAWNPEDGFAARSTYSDDLPDEHDLRGALEFVRRYEAGLAAVLDATSWDVAKEESRLAKPLERLAQRLTAQRPVRAILVVGEPLPPGLAGGVVYLGDKAKEPSKAARSPSSPKNGDYRDLRNLASFDTPQWEARLCEITAEEVEEIVRCGAYQDSLDRLNHLRAQLEKRFARRSEIIDAVCTAAVAMVPTVLIGPPGTAKSNVIRCMCEGLGLTGLQTSSDGTAGRKYFEYLLTRFTTPEEIFGPIHVQDLIDRQVYRRVTAGYLPEAQVAFLDEIFKASSAILNTLLTLLNERVFYNAGAAVRVPLIMVFAASNKGPGDESLSALFDRFPLRITCQPVPDEHVDELLAVSWAQSYDRQFSSGSTAMEVCACTNDLRLMHHVMRVRFGCRRPGERAGAGIDFIDEFDRFFRALRSDFGISDRTLALLLAYARSHALLHGRGDLTAEDLDVFRYVVWDESGSGELDRLVSNMKRGVRL